MLKKLPNLLIVCCSLLISCSSDKPESPKTQHKLNLKAAISNNAVAKAEINNHGKTETWLYSFNGLETGKTWQDVSSRAFAVNPASGESIELKSVPNPSSLSNKSNSGRLASVAATVNNQIYIFGGYTVAEDHSEVSTPEVYRFDPQSQDYELVTKMPTPVDDSVALVYQNRYIYLVSGWHNDGNVDLVQVLDTQDMSWHRATPYPGAPAFGQAAGIVDNQMVISDGVKVLKIVNGKRHYGISDDNYLGKIDADDFRKIHWQKLAMHPDKARYRMAATGSKRLNKVLFVGGSDNPYNFNGIGYNGVPSEPHNLIFAYDFTSGQWQELGKQEPATMDHRALLEVGEDFYILGGMLQGQKTIDRTFKLKL